MDERSVLIMIDKRDLTKKVVHYSIEEEEVHITYSSRSEPYKYGVRRVDIRTNPMPLVAQGKTALHEGMPLRNVQEILDFRGMLKIFFKDEKTEVFDSASIRMEQAGHSTVLNVMNYWEDIAQYTKTDDEVDAFLKRQYSRLNSVHPDSVLAAYMNQTPITQAESNTTSVIYPFRFNLSQKQALEQALVHKISVIVGPPGTGKTQTILNILANLTMMQNKSVAVVSGNNAAVQNVRDKLQKEGYGFMAASLGNMKNRELFFENLPDYDVSGWKSEKEEAELAEAVADLTKRLNRLLELANRKAKLDQDIAAYRLEQKHFQIQNDQHDLDGMERLFYRHQTPETVIAFLADEYFQHNRSFRFLHKAKLLFKYGFIRFKDLKENRLELITHLQMKYYESKLAQLEQLEHEIQSELERESFEELLNQHTENSSQLFKHRLYDKYNGKKRFSGTCKNYKLKFDDFIEYFPILLSTTHSLCSCMPNKHLFDYVIIDEASQVDLLTGVLAMSCCRSVIIVGDTKQLPQIVDKKIQSKLKPSDVPDVFNYFKHSLLSSILEMHGDHIPKVILKEHYRCRPRIIGFCNNQYYNNELIPFTTEEESDISIRLHYTAVGNHMRRVTIKGKEGNLNHREIEAVREEILRELQLSHFSNEDIGFATPYRLQVEEAVSMMDKDIEIDTVHKYQGREKPVMILSTVLDQTRNGQIGKKFVEDPCLVNVAVSRAQKQFILVTDHALFRNSRKDIGNLIRYIEYNTLHEHITHSELISVFDLLYSEYSQKLNDLQNRLIFKSKYKSENIMWRVLSDLVQEEKYKCVVFGTQVYLKDVFKNTERLDEREKDYMANRASFDFVIYDAINKQPLLAIEVDGFASHRNNPDQTERDRKKNAICEKYKFHLRRLPTTGSDEIAKIRSDLERILYGTANTGI